MQSIISDLRKRKIKLWLEGDKLKFSAPDGALNQEILSQLKEHKPDLIKLLRTQLDKDKGDSETRISVVSRDQDILASFAQQRMWFIEQFEEDSQSYNVQLTIKFEKKIDLRALESALVHLQGRHEVFRTAFEESKSSIYQRLMPPKPISLSVEKISQTDNSFLDSKIIKHLEVDLTEPFDLSSGYLIRFKFLLFPDGSGVLAFTTHHIIFDGWSMGIFIKELLDVYQSVIQNRPLNLPDLRLQYADYSDWHWKQQRQSLYDDFLVYWNQLSRDVEPLHSLPTDYPRPFQQTFRGSVCRFEVEKRDIDGLLSIAKERSVTLYVVLLSVYLILIMRYSGKYNAVIGTPIANRNSPELETMIGSFVNIIVIVAKVNPKFTFGDVLEHVSDLTANALKYQDMPFDKLVEILRPERTNNFSPIFQLMFSLQNTPVSKMNLVDVQINSYRAHTGNSMYDLTLSMEYYQGRLTGEFEYNSSLFEKETISRFVDCFKKLCRSVFIEETSAINALDMMPDYEYQNLVGNFSGKQNQYKQFESVIDRFRRNAKRTPNSTALVFNSQRISYKALDQKSDLIAANLISLGVANNSVIGICLPKNTDLIVLTLAVLKTGAAYLPLDPDYPNARLEVMIADARPSFILTPNKNYVGELEFDRELSECKLINPEELNMEFDLDGFGWPSVHPQQSAYCIFTSGSTGRPKGVLISHKNLSDTLEGWIDDYCLTANDVHLQMASFSFDVFAGDMARALGTGAKLVLCSKESLLQQNDLCRLIIRERVNCAEFVPAVASLLSDYLDRNNLKLIFFKVFIVGSDSISYKSLRKIRSVLGPKTKLINSYGVTEATIDNAYYQFLDDKKDVNRVPIGVPYKSSVLYILDSELQLIPQGAIGELCIGGTTVSDGYLQNPKLTAQRFVPDPFSETGERLYRTGDLARFNNDGEIELIGRADDQVKIRGYRVELGDIEAAILKIEWIAQVCVVLKSLVKGRKALCAYIVLNEFSEKSEQAEEYLTRKLSEDLPSYMIPDFTIVLAELPLSPNGKVDKNKLPEIEESKFCETTEFQSPESESEKAIAAIWSEVLHIPPEKIGRDTGFFNEGGHSVLAAKVIMRLQEIFSCVIPIKTIFELSKLRDLANYIDKNNRYKKLVLAKNAVDDVKQTNVEEFVF